MPAQQKLIVFLIALLAIFLFYPKKAFAQIVINELLPNPTGGSDWVELYNTSSQEIDLNDWVLDDEGTKTNMVEIKEVTVSAHGFWLFEVGSRLNKSSDTIYLINNEEVVVDEYNYSTNPGDDVSFGRAPDGGNWGVCDKPTPNLENQCVLPSPSPSPSPTPSPSQSQSPTLSPSPQTETNSHLDEAPSPTPTPKPVKVVGATLLGEILGEESSPAAFYSWEASEEAEDQEATEASKTSFLPKLFLGLGLGFLFASGFYLWYTQRS